MILLIKKGLLQIIEDIDSGNSNLNEDDLKQLFETISNLTRLELSKIEATHYLNMSRATFDNYINKGLLPEGLKRSGFKELCWLKSDLNKFLDTEYGKKWKDKKLN